MIEFACEAIWPWAFVCWKIVYYNFNLHACDWSVHIFCFLSVQVWKVILFQELVPFLPTCSFYWHVIAHTILLWSFVFLCCHNFSFFIFNFIDLSLLPFVLDGIISFIFSHNQLCNEFCYSFHFFFICFFSDLCDFFPSTKFGFCLFFFL